MGNDVQLHESVVERAPGEDRRASPRHPAAALGSVSARIIGGSQVELVNYSSHGVLFECDSRLLIGARASVRITTTHVNLIVTGRVVRSRVKGLVNGALRYDAALALDNELALLPAVVEEAPAPEVPEPVDDVAFDSDEIAFESETEIDGVFDPSPVEAYLAESDAALAEVARVVAPEPQATVPEPELLPEPEPEPMALDAAVEAGPVEVELELAADEPADDEPIAFEADTEIAFEASSDFEFEAMPDVAFEGEPPAVAAESLIVEAHVVYTPRVDAAPGTMPAPEPEPASQFDATYVAPHVEPLSALSQFDATPPSHYTARSSSMFDARPSETYDGAPVEDAKSTVLDPLSFRTDPDPAMVPAPVTEAEPVVEAAGDAIDFETEVAFEAADAVLFESAFAADGTDAVFVAEPVEPPAIPVVEAVETVETAEVVDVVHADESIQDLAPATPADVLESIESIEPLEPLDEHAVGLDESLADLPIASAPDDRQFQFSSTVPHDLAELRRIAADNQW